jgi:hypothetical protein
VLLQILHAWKEYASVHKGFAPINAVMRKSPWSRTSHDLDLIARTLKATSPFFDSLPDWALQCYVRILRLKLVRPNVLLYAQGKQLGDDSDVWFVILHGSVDTRMVRRTHLRRDMTPFEAPFCPSAVAFTPSICIDGGGKQISFGTSQGFFFRVMGPTSAAVW